MSGGKWRLGERKDRVEEVLDGKIAGYEDILF